MSDIKSNADIEPCLSVVMPVYNEAATVAEMIQIVLLQRPVQQLIVVDDASTDGTWDKMKSIAGDDPRGTSAGEQDRTDHQLLASPPRDGGFRHSVPNSPRGRNISTAR